MMVANWRWLVGDNNYTQQLQMMLIHLKPIIITFHKNDRHMLRKIQLESLNIVVSVRCLTVRSRLMVRIKLYNLNLMEGILFITTYVDFLSTCKTYVNSILFLNVYIFYIRNIFFSYNIKKSLIISLKWVTLSLYKK